MCALGIGDLSRRTGTPVATIRYYESRGLLPRPGRTEGHQRRYGSEDIARLAFVRARRDLGFSIPEILVLLERSGPDVAPCPTARQSAERQLEKVRRQIASLRSVEAELVTQIESCGADCSGSGAPDCLLVPP